MIGKKMPSNSTSDMVHYDNRPWTIRCCSAYSSIVGISLMITIPGLYYYDIEIQKAIPNIDNIINVITIQPIVLWFYVASLKISARLNKQVFPCSVPTLTIAIYFIVLWIDKQFAEVLLTNSALNDVNFKYFLRLLMAMVAFIRLSSVKLESITIKRLINSMITVGISFGEILKTSKMLKEVTFVSSEKIMQDIPSRLQIIVNNYYNISELNSIKSLLGQCEDVKTHFPGNLPEHIDRMINKYPFCLNIKKLNTNKKKLTEVLFNNILNDHKKEIKYLSKNELILCTKNAYEILLMQIDNLISNSKKLKHNDKSEAVNYSL
jgi:hypothetical protein